MNAIEDGKLFKIVDDDPIVIYILRIRNT